MSTVIKTENLSKKYGKFLAVDQVNMVVNQGDIYGFIGKNGAGKTTFMKIICGLAKPTEGEIELFGSKELQKGQQRIGCAIENPALYPDFTARENILYYNRALGIASDDNVDELLKLVGLTDTGKKKVKKFSLGMKQRLAIAIALVGNPDLLVLDEPINGLDPYGIREVRELLLKLNQEKNITILISSHILGELTKIATKYGIISKGALVDEFEAEELVDRCKQCIKIEVNEIEKAAYVLEHKVQSNDYKVYGNNTICIYDKIDNPGYVNKLLVEEGIIVNHLAFDGQDVESYFIKMMGGQEND